MSTHFCNNVCKNLSYCSGIECLDHRSPRLVSETRVVEVDKFLIAHMNLCEQLHQNSVQTARAKSIIQVAVSLVCVTEHTV